MALLEKLEEKHSFAEVSKGKLYRSAQPTLGFLLYLKRVYRIKTIVSLRKKTEDFERNFTRQNGVRLINVPIKAFLHFPELEDIETFLALFKNSENCPVLLHCREGKHRTGFMTAVFRFIHEKKSLEETLTEMKQRGIHFHWRFFLKLKAEQYLQIRE